MISARPVDPVALSAYAVFPAVLDRDWVGRVAHLSEADLSVIRRRADPVTQLGYAAQLARYSTVCAPTAPASRNTWAPSRR